ncbi:MAG: amidohydrolase [Rhodospirillaceae bacterium]|nr:amidohydrolase [Rhodospirillaceae bacterium]
MIAHSAKATCVLVLTCLWGLCVGVAHAQPADWLLTNGKFYTLDSTSAWARAAAVKDGKFMFVGAAAKAARFAGPDTRITDLGGRMVIPGMVDAHTHPGLIELEQFDAQIDAASADEFFHALRALATSEDTGDGWLRIWCWPNEAFVDGLSGPDRAGLDVIFPERPVWISSCAWHSYWLNGAALAALGVSETTPDPKFPVAMYARDESGRLTGWVKEGAGWQHQIDVFERNVELHRQSMRSFLDTLSRLGVTALYDGGNLDYADEVYAFLHSLEQAGQLPLRYEGTYMVSVPEARHRAVAEMRRYRARYGGERLRFNTVKLFMDGVHENRSAAMLEPYADTPGYRSDTILTDSELTDFLLSLHAARLDLHVHVIGDLAVRRVLNAVQAARAATGPSFYPRVSMGHLQNIHADDWRRFGELGVGANFTPWWHGPDPGDTVSEAFEAERLNDMYRAAALLEHGANVTFSSDDWNLDVLSPFLGMQVGHTRQYPREWWPRDQDPQLIRQPASERLPLADLLKGYSLNGAYQLRLEDRMGSISVGKEADLVVLPENLFDVDPYRLHAVEPDAVIFAGELIHGTLR